MAMRWGGVFLCLSVVLLSAVAQDDGPFLFCLSFNTVGDESLVNRGTAASQSKTTLFTKTGVTYTSTSPDESASAVWLSQVDQTDVPENTFSEMGNISFGNGRDGISFDSRVYGVSSQEGQNAFGSISYEITGGSGAYEGARGWLVDYFWGFGDSPSFLINAWGWFYIPASSSSSSSSSPSPPSSSSFPPSPISSSLPFFPHFRPTQNERRGAEYKRVEFVAVFENLPVDGVNHATAPSQSILTKVSYDSPLAQASKNLSDNPLANWTSFPKSYPNGTFSNQGTIALIDNGELLASFSFYNNVLGMERDTSQYSYGGITYWIDHGEGYWEGASGVMVDLFVAPVDDNGATPIYVWAMFWVPAF